MDAYDLLLYLENPSRIGREIEGARFVMIAGIYLHRAGQFLRVRGFPALSLLSLPLKPFANSEAMLVAGGRPDGQVLHSAS